jgi:hypothetical protein
MRPSKTSLEFAEFDITKKTDKQNPPWGMTLMRNGPALGLTLRNCLSVVIGRRLTIVDNESCAEEGTQ